jgi:hypothetical protein
MCAPVDGTLLDVPTLEGAGASTRRWIFALKTLVA